MNNIDQFFTKDASHFAKSYINYLSKILQSIDTMEVSRFIDILICAREQNANIFFIGNGGSAATASHFANDLSIGTGCHEKPFRAISLTDNIAIITAIANDFGYDEIFSKQLKVLGSKGDVLVGISASGNSPNLLTAFNYAKAAQITTVAITAFDGGKMKQIADLGVHIPTGLKEYGPAEDAHMVLDHLIGSYLVRLLSQK